MARDFTEHIARVETEQAVRDVIGRSAWDAVMTVTADAIKAGKSPAEIGQVAANASWKEIVKHYQAIKREISRIKLERARDSKTFLDQLISVDLSRALPIARGFYFYSIQQLLLLEPNVAQRASLQKAIERYGCIDLLSEPLSLTLLPFLAELGGGAGLGVTELVRQYRGAPDWEEVSRRLLRIE